MQLTVTSVQGLEVQSNSFTVADGTFQRAKNVVVKRQNLVTKRRGYNLLTANSTVPNAVSLIAFKDALLLAFNGRLGNVNTTTGTTTLLPGALTLSNGAKPRSSLANNNLYLASATGVRKLELPTSTVIDAGLPPGLDLTAVRNLSNGGVTGAEQVGYRVTFTRTDLNNNLLESAPSDFAVFANTPVEAASSWATLTAPGPTPPAGPYIHFTLGVSPGYSGTIDVTITNSSNTTVLPDTTYLAIISGVNVYIPKAFTGTPTGTATVTIHSNATINFSVPAGIGLGDYYRVYRTDGSGTLDVPPDESTLKKIAEIGLGNVSEITFVDNVPYDLAGAYLYTNPTTAEGIAQSNTPPPFARDIALFKYCQFYANTSIPYNLLLDLITTKAGSLDLNDLIVISDSSAPLAVTNITVPAGSQSRFFIANANTQFVVGQYVVIQDAVSAGNNGTFIVLAVTSTYIDVSNGGAVVGTTATAYKSRAYKASAAESFNTTAGGDFKLTPSVSSVYQPITDTALSLIKAINRDSNGIVYANYISTPPDPTSGAISQPGRLSLSSRTLARSFFVTSNAGDAFSPEIPVSGQTLKGQNDAFTNRLFYSKEQQPEAVPRLNYFDVGPRTSTILRIVPLRDSLIIITSTGVYRLVGNSPADFSLYALDLTTVCVAADSVQALNNQVYMFSTQGVVAVSDTVVQVMSSAIEPLLSAVLTKSNIALLTDATSYDSERLYLLSTASPQSSVKDVVYVFNAFTNTWTTWDTNFLDGLVNPAEDIMYFVDSLGNLVKERKNNNKLDYADRSYDITIDTISSDGTTATVSIPPGIVVNTGSVIVVGEVIGRISAVVGNTVTFAAPVSFKVGAASLYQGITSEVFSNPLTAGDPSRMKQFSEFQMHFRTRSCSRALVSFASDNTNETPQQTWINLATSNTGWGNEDWGLFSWGQQEGISTIYETEANQILRVYIPINAERSTYVMSRVIHSQAAESFEVQAVATTARAYGQRVAR